MDSECCLSTAQRHWVSELLGSTTSELQTNQFQLCFKGRWGNPFLCTSTFRCPARNILCFLFRGPESSQILSSLCTGSQEWPSESSLPKHWEKGPLFCACLVCSWGGEQDCDALSVFAMTNSLCQCQDGTAGRGYQDTQVPGRQTEILNYYVAK